MNCNGCRACCLFKAGIILQPGDDPSLYETVEVDGQLVIAPGKGNACRYLGPKGCTIYDKRPAQCRAFDCRPMARHAAATMNRAERRRHPYRDVFKAGLARL